MKIGVSLKSKSCKISQNFECNWVHDWQSSTPKELVIVTHELLSVVCSKKVAIDWFQDKEKPSAGGEVAF